VQEIVGKYMEDAETFERERDEARTARDRYLTCLAESEDVLPPGHGGKPLEGVKAVLAALAEERARFDWYVLNDIGHDTYETFFQDRGLDRFVPLTPDEWRAVIDEARSKI